MQLGELEDRERMTVAVTAEDGIAAREVIELPMRQSAEVEAERDAAVELEAESQSSPIALLARLRPAEIALMRAFTFRIRDPSKESLRRGGSTGRQGQRRRTYSRCRDIASAEMPSSVVKPRTSGNHSHARSTRVRNESRSRTPIGFQAHLLRCPPTSI
jgi:hypothetical protein